MGHRAVLSSQHEADLVDHIHLMERTFWGLTTIDVRKFAFTLAERLGINDHPFNHASKMAGSDWLRSFMKRHPGLSIRVPEATSMARAVGFNRPKVDQYFDIYDQVLDGGNFGPQSIWNADESGITNVQKPCKILATKGVRQVSKITSAERGKTVTVMCSGNAAGRFIPPFMIWPRQRMAGGLMNGTPPGSTGIASPSGWMDSDLFLTWLQHFVQHTKCTKDDPQVLIVDGHHSHKTLEAGLYARDNRMIIITLPPHSTHRMQPLDRTFFKPLKSAYNQAADQWMRAHPGRRISFYDMGGIFGTAYTR